MLGSRVLLVGGWYIAVLASSAQGAGPFGSIHVGEWSGGAYTNDQTGAFSHCSAATGYASGVDRMPPAIGYLVSAAQHFV
jgi:hypothetical protein